MGPVLNPFAWVIVCVIVILVALATSTVVGVLQSIGSRFDETNKNRVKNIYVPLVVVLGVIGGIVFILTICNGLYLVSSINGLPKPAS